MQFEGLAGVIADYINQRKLQKLEPIEKKLEKALSSDSDEIEKSKIKTECLVEMQQIEQQFKEQNWLSEAAKRAYQISFVTHALKFTHGDAKGSSILSLNYLEDTDYLTTASVPNLAIDAVGNASALDVAKFLQLEYAGKSLAQALMDNDLSSLAQFSADQLQLDQWASGLKLALTEKSLSSHTLAKQLYFPVGNGEYHILNPIFASSLATQFNDKIKSSRFSDEAKTIRDARKTDEYHEKPDIRFLNTAIQHFGGTKPQNISLLNSQRRGETYLLNCAAPSWKVVLKPPVNEKSIFFSRELDRRTFREFQEFQRYLVSIKGLDSTLNIRRSVVAHVNDIIDALLNYASQIQALSECAGWSLRDCELKLSEQLWLDTWCADLKFQQKRADENWQQDICFEFGSWLNKRLNDSSKHKGLLFGKPQQQHWAKLFAPLLREYELGTAVFSENMVRTEAAL